MPKLLFEKTYEKVTREMAAQNTLLFLPETEKQATYVQQRLFALGFIWANDVKKVQSLEECTANGIVLKNQRIYYLGEDDEAKGYKLCALEQLAEDYIAPAALTPPSPDRLMQMFSEVTARLSAIENRLSKIEERLAPEEPPQLQKPAIRRPQ
ncbi:MAG: hypothetical protein Q8K65_10500 [Alphaproteobacteria bacterium]|nr:hypothetical protein [Alphaproteobacteria bacterium]